MLFQYPQAADIDQVLSLPTTLFIVIATDGYLLFILFSFASVPHSLCLNQGKLDLTFQWLRGEKRKTGGSFLPSEKIQSLQSHLKSIADDFTKPHVAPDFTRRHHKAVGGQLPVSLLLVKQQFAWKTCYVTQKFKFTSKTSPASTTFPSFK